MNLEYTRSDFNDISDHSLYIVAGGQTANQTYRNKTGGILYGL